jgi:ribose transport system ATP-binding protein
MTAYAVQMEAISKSFNRIPVLRDVDFALQVGEVHALVGGNGAGKSTLMKILQGVYIPDSGRIVINEKPVQIHSVKDAQALGIGMVFQEFSLIPTLTVAQNIFLTHEPRGGGGLINDREANNRARALFGELSVDINPKAPVESLSTGYWQMTEIAKALSQNARVLIMDEPTASLTVSETLVLFDLIRTLKSKGISIIYISHRMEEIFQIADRITVLRDGQCIATSLTAETTINQVIERIVGRKMEHAFAWQERKVDRTRTPLLEVKNLVAGERVQDISFSLHAGEILGLAGLMGSGRTELARALFGIDPIRSGQILVRGNQVNIRNPQDALSSSICLIPEDRRAQGLVLDHTVKDNMLLPLLRSLQCYGIINDEMGNQLVQSYVDSLSIKTDSISKVMRYLSGGNQQKVVIAKWLAYKPEILLMDEPTAGVDIGAKTEILDIIRRLADEGKGVLLISSEFTELLAVADRVLIIRNGVIKQEYDRQEIPTEEILHHAVQRVSAKEVKLSREQLASIKAMKAKAAISMHYLRSDWSTAQVAGMKEQFKEMGIEVLAVTDADFNAEKQSKDIELLIAMKPDVIVSIPTDTLATVDAYRKAVQNGIKLIFIDNVPKGFKPGIDYISMVSADNYGNGVAAAHILAESLNSTGKIGLLFHSANFWVTQQRYRGLKTTLADNYPNIHIVDERGVTGPDFAGEAEKLTRDMLAEHPELNGIWAVWDVPAEGVVAALRSADRSDIVVITQDLGKNMAVEIAKNGIVKGVGAQRPFDQGVTEAMLAGYALLDEPAPADVSLSALPVTRDNVVEVWKAIYHQNPPAELLAAKKS